MTKYFRNNWHLIVFTLTVLIIYLGINFQQLIFMRPMGEHAWAQIDRASIALLYFQNDVNFFLPQTHNVALNPSGIALGEFPLQPYFVSLLYRLFGYHEFLFRITVVVSCVTGFFMAFFIANRFINNKMFVLLVSILWIVSPNLIYYSTGFLPDTLSLTLMLCGFYFLMNKFPEIQFKNLLWFVLFASFSLLEKSSALFIYAPVCLGIALHLRQQKIGWLPIIKKLTILVIPFVILATWILYAAYIQHKYPSNVFLLKPKFPQSVYDFYVIAKGFAGKLSDFYSFFIFVILFLAVIFIIRNFRKVPVFFTAIILCSIFAWFLFFVTLSRQAWFHGYYHIPFQFIVFIMLLTAMSGLEKSNVADKFKILTPVLLFVAFYFGFSNVRDYFSKKAWHYDLINKDWMDASLTLDQLGVSAGSKIITYDDHSYNISLYLMNRRGWNIESQSWDYFIEKALNDCDYMVLTNDNLLKKESVRPFIGPFKGRHGTLLIYKINKAKSHSD